MGLRESEDVGLADAAGWVDKLGNAVWESQTEKHLGRSLEKKT